MGEDIQTWEADPQCTNCGGSGIEPGSGEYYPPYGIDPGSYEPCECVLIKMAREAFER